MGNHYDPGVPVLRYTYKNKEDNMNRFYDPFNNGSTISDLGMSCRCQNQSQGIPSCQPSCPPPCPTPCPPPCPTPCPPIIGPTGPTGPTGPAGNTTITVGNTTTGQPGTVASVFNRGTPSAAILDFVIPAGPTGPTGPAGATGATAPSIYAQHGNCRNHAAFHYLKDN